MGRPFTAWLSRAAGVFASTLATPGGCCGAHRGRRGADPGVAQRRSASLGVARSAGRALAFDDVDSHL